MEKSRERSVASSKKKISVKKKPFPSRSVQSKSTFQVVGTVRRQYNKSKRIDSRGAKDPFDAILQWKKDPID